MLLTVFNENYDQFITENNTALGIAMYFISYSRNIYLNLSLQSCFFILTTLLLLFCF
jgi:hypothetical protein